MGKIPFWPRLRPGTGLPPPSPPSQDPSPSSSPSNGGSSGGGGGPALGEDRHDNRVVGSATCILPSMMIMISKRALQASFAATLVLYVLNQKHLLPRPLSAVVSHVLFWPTLPVTISRRIGHWTTNIDETVILGGAPFGHWPERLYYNHQVRGIINLCREYRGPIRHYERLGMEELYLPTTDHFEPTVGDLETAVNFIAQYQQHGKRVYVHCRAGHGRSAAVVFAWLLRQEMLERRQKRDDNDDGPVVLPPNDDQDDNEDVAAALLSAVDLEALNRKMSRLRNVRTGLWRQPNIRLYHQWLIDQIMVREKQQKEKKERGGGDDTGDLRPSRERQQPQQGHLVDDDDYDYNDKIDKEL
jgi:hypothetical protein